VNAYIGALLGLGTPHSARVLHRVLFGGLLLLSVIFLLITFGLHDAPLMAPGESATMIGFVFAASGLILVIAAITFFRQRVPTRASGQDDATFWRAALGPAVSVWVMIVGAGMISAVGALLTGSLASALVVAFALDRLLRFPPSHFEST
jgi:hypothetical protein